MIRFFYTLLLVIASPILLLILYRKKTGKPTFGKRWKEHFGFTPAVFKSENQKILWIHAVSVGEVIGVSSLIKAIKQQNPSYKIVVTTTTATGAQQVEKLGELVEHRYMPIDFAWTVRGFLKSVRPDEMIIMETELWPNTLVTVSKKKIPITVINARLSERSANRYQRFPSIFKLFSLSITKILCQHQDDANRFLKLGVPLEKLTVTGSLKFDITIDLNWIEKGKELREQLTSNKLNSFVWIAASTHQGEDEQILDAHQQLLDSYPQSILILVPRHPERFDSVYQLIQDQGLTVSRRTEKEFQQDAQVYLADTMGEMLILMAASDICFMGGSLLGEKVGGHNLLEPAALGVPTITGPSYYNFSDITEQLVQAKATSICTDAKSLSQQVMVLFSQKEILKEKGKQSLAVVQRNTGAIDKTLQTLNLK